MVGYKTRYLSAEERNAIGIRRLKRKTNVGTRRKAGARAAGSADAADRGGMRRAASAVASAGVMVVAVAVLVRLLPGNSRAPMVRLAEHHQHAGVAAQR